MEPCFANQRNRALTRTDVLFAITVIILVVIIASMLLPVYAAKHRYRISLECRNNVAQIIGGFQLWENDHNGKFPMEISVKNGGTKESAAAGDAVTTFQIMSNELRTPKILICPGDKIHWAATNFNAFTAKNISYFVGLDATPNYPKAYLSGDDNFWFNGGPVKSGILELSVKRPEDWINIPLNWDETRADDSGTIGCVDGDVRETYWLPLRNNLYLSGFATNRLIIP